MTEAQRLGLYRTPAPIPTTWQLLCPFVYSVPLNNFILSDSSSYFYSLKISDFSTTLALSLIHK